MIESDETVPLPGGNETTRWLVVHVRPRCEKKIADFCRRRNMVCYLPLVKRAKVYAGRRRVHEIPVFRGYVFVLAEKTQAALLRNCDYAANLLEVHDQALLVNQLNQIRTALACAGAAELLPEFKTGMKVEIKSGPMQGIEGIVVKVKNATHIILNVDFIQQSLSVEVNADWLVPV